tara:strand:- start:434 stop:886 length:453 start_codon:yes stop_codon:yes gene_type:complete
MTLKPFQVEVPWWAADEQDQDYILFLAFMYKLGLAYGFRKIFLVYDSDVRMFLGKTGVIPRLAIPQKAWAKYVQVGQAYDDRSAYKLKMVDPDRLDSKRARIVEITDPRCQLIWIYLLGAFNNNLVEREGHTKRMGIDRIMRAKLLKGDM